MENDFLKLAVKSFTCQDPESGLCTSPAEITKTLAAGSCIPSAVVRSEGNRREAHYHECECIELKGQGFSFLLHFIPFNVRLHSLHG